MGLPGLPDPSTVFQQVQGTVQAHINPQQMMEKITGKHEETAAEKKHHDAVNEKKIDALVHDGKGPLTKKEELLKKSFDKNHDGKFSDEEVKEAAAALGKKVSSANNGPSFSATTHHMASVSGKGIGSPS